MDAEDFLNDIVDEAQEEEDHDLQPVWERAMNAYVDHLVEEGILDEADIEEMEEGFSIEDTDSWNVTREQVYLAIGALGSYYFGMRDAGILEQEGVVRLHRMLEDAMSLTAELDRQVLGEDPLAEDA